MTVLDRNDRLLRAYTTPDGRWRLPVDPKDVDARYLAMLIAFEDKRFRAHHGVDPWAVGRAGWQLVRHGRIVSGGSTLTMQVARLVQGEHERNASGKIRQALRALALERRLSKDAILRLYLRLAPFGGNLEGVRAASLAYFGKEPRRLSLAEAALLVALPQAPEARRPNRYPETARRARNRVLAYAAAAGVISHEDATRAMAERMPVARREFPILAPHLSDAEVERDKARNVHRLTIDATHQANLEQLVREHAGTLGGRLSAALIAVDHKTGEVVAHVGSPGYLDEARFGAVDMTSAIRSPGSTLKPFVYGLAFEAGLAHPETLIEDRPSRFGLYVPKNFDMDWHGTVTIRMALAQSLNIPAVKVLEALGPAKLTGRLTQAGVEPVLPKGAEPSLAIALGGLGLKLSDLASLYAGLARGGEPVALKYRRDAPEPKAPVDAAAADAGGGLVRRRHPAQCAGAGQRQARPARLQDGDLLRLPRCLGGGLRRAAHDRRLGRPARRRRHTGARGAHRRGAAAVRCLRPPVAAAHAFAAGTFRRAEGRRRRPAAAAQALPRGQGRGDGRHIPRARRPDRLPARPGRARDGGRRQDHHRQGRGRRPAAHLAGRRRAHRQRSRQARSGIAGGQRLP